MIPIALVALAALFLWLALVRLHRNPKRTLAIAVYPDGSLNSELAKRYREILARDGVDLRPLPSPSAVESLARLRDRESGISAALIPDDITKEQDSPELVSLGTLFYRPLWVFSRGDLPQTHKSFAVSAYESDRNESSPHALELLGRDGIIDQKLSHVILIHAVGIGPKGNS